MKVQNRCWLFITLAVLASLALSLPQVMAAGYPAISFTHTDVEWIVDVKLDTIQNFTNAASANGYGDFTVRQSGLMADVVPGGTYSLSVTIHPGTHNDFLYAFFDWNGNGSFADPGESVTLAADTSAAGPHTTDVTVPAAVVAGEIRLRVVLVFDHNVPISSGALYSGEAEDYSLWVPGPGVYKPIWGDNAAEWIAKVSFSSISNVTPHLGKKGYYDVTFATYPSSSIKYADIVAGATYPLGVTIQPGSSSQYVRAFFDWNGNGIFTDPGEEFAVATAVDTAGPHTKSITVPAGAKPGEIRMRIVLTSSSSTPPNWGDIGSGEAQDYSLWLPGPGVYPPIWSLDNSKCRITNVTFGAIDNDTGQEKYGYGDYTFGTASMTANVLPGETYQLGVTIDTTLLANVRVFFDWNGNGLFTDPGEQIIVVTDTSSAGPHTADVTVPRNDRPGEVRMRVVLNEYDIPHNWGFFDYGEAEDYSVNVKNEFPWIMFLPAITNNAQP